MIKKLLVFISALAVASWPIDILAEGLQHLPKWHMREGEACYTLSDAKLLFEADSRITMYLEKEKACTKLVEDQLSLNADLLEWIERASQDLRILKKQNDELYNELQSCVVQRTAAHAAIGKYSWLWFIGGLIVGAATTGVAVYYAD